MVRTPMEPRIRVVDNPAGPVTERHILALIAHFFLSYPARDVGLGEPETIGSQRPRNRRIPPPHDALTRRRIVWKGADGGRNKIIHRLNKKCCRRPGILSWDDRRKDPCAVVGHRQS